MKKISYYELLGNIKKNNIPDEVIYKFNNSLITYKAAYDGNSFSHYELKNHSEENEIIKFYLNENYLESDMFRKDILIDTDIYIVLKNKKVFRESLKEDKNIEKLSNVTIYGSTISSLRNELQATNKRFENKINEIIDKIKGE